MRIGIFGAGGVGGYFGARLAAAGNDVTFVARGAHGAAMRERGLTVSSTIGDLHLEQVQITEDPAHAGPFDVVLVAVKAWQVDDAARALQGAVAAHGAVIPLLNGVEAPDRLAAVLEPSTVLGGLCGIIAFIEGPGHIRHAGMEPFIQLGERGGGRSERTVAIAAALDEAEGMTVTVPDDMRVALWMKFLFIVAMSGVGAVTRAPIGVTREDPATRELLVGCVREVFEVGCASGVALPHDAVEQTMKVIDGVLGTATASMQRDIMQGRPSELSAQNEAVVRLGRAVGVGTPVNAFLSAALSPLERRARGEVAFL